MAERRPSDHAVVTARAHDELPPRLVSLPPASTDLETRAAQHLLRIQTLRPPPADMIARVEARLSRAAARGLEPSRRRRPLVPRLAWASLGLAATAFALVALRPALRSASRDRASRKRASAVAADWALPRLARARALRRNDVDQARLSGSGEAAALVAADPDSDEPPRNRWAPLVGQPPETCRGFVPGDDLPVCGATYVGGAGADAPSAIDMGAGDTILVAGVFEAAGFGAPSRREIQLLGGGDGAIFRFNRTGRALVGVTRVGSAITDLEADRATGDILIGVEPFGLLLLDADAREIKWNRTHGADRVAVGADGTVAALDIRQGRVALFTRTGETLGTLALPTGAIGADVAVEGQSHTLVVAGEVPGTPAMPFLRGYAYDGTQKWSAWSWSADEARGRRLTASARGVRVTTSRDGKVLFAGRAQGGNSIFLNDPRELGKRLPDPGYDKFSVATNIGNESVLFVARFAPSDGALEAHQFGLTRDDGPKERGKSMVPVSIAVDEAGYVYVAGFQTGLMEGDGRKSVRGIPLKRSRRDAFALVLTPDLGQRLLWTTFGTGAPAAAVGVAAGGGVVAFAALQERAAVAAPLAAFEPLQPRAPGGATDGYLAVWPAP